MSEKRILRVGLIQQANTADHSDNKRRLKEAIRSAAAQGAELVVLQELHNGLYFCQTEDVQRLRPSGAYPWAKYGGVRRAGCRAGDRLSPLAL